MKLWKLLAKNNQMCHYSGGFDKEKTSKTHPPHSRAAIRILSAIKSSQSSLLSDDSGRPSSSVQDKTRNSFKHLATTFTASVQLQKRAGESLGIILSSPSSTGSSDNCPSIAGLRPGSVAINSDQLVPGDRICSVNGINTSRMRADEVSTLLENIDDNAALEIQYSLPYFASQNSVYVTTKVAEVTLERVDGSLGITLRGGHVPDRSDMSKPLIVTHVRPNGPAQRCGLIRVGDRLLKVDNHSLITKNLLEAQHLLKEPPCSNSLTRLTIEYDINIMESVNYATGPLLVEVERQNEENFGLVLTNACNMSAENSRLKGCFIEQIVPASTADRCGALHVGDEILAIDDVELDSWSLSRNAIDVETLLRTATKIQIMPMQATKRTKPLLSSQSPPQSSGYSTNSFTSRLRFKSAPDARRSSLLVKSDRTLGENCYGRVCGHAPNMHLSHPEILSISLTADRDLGYGLEVVVEDRNDGKPADILISRITPDSPAHRSGCLQVGDRILSVNHQTNLTIQEITAILNAPRDSSINSSTGLRPSSTTDRVQLETEFDVADAIVPSSGIFSIKVARRAGSAGLGITIVASKLRPDDPFLISEIKRGSVAHRTGMLDAGDRLLAIDNKPLNQHTAEAGFEALQGSTNDIVVLKVEKTDSESAAGLSVDSITYTVELQRYGGPLGITISGSDDCMEPIVLSKIAEGGLADKTGALHVGDRILAINGENLEARPLSDAIRSLQSSGDKVQLKIARTILDTRRPSDYASPGGASADSAVHSWDGSPDAKDDLERTESVLSDSFSCSQDSSSMSVRDSRLQFYCDGDQIPSHLSTSSEYCPSPLPLPNYNLGTSMASDQFPTRDISIEDSHFGDSLQDHEIHHIILYKDSIYDDYGFSVSDGLYQKGVYVNRIRNGGPADIVGLLKPFDRIIQVNDISTKDFDCCLTVPLIAAAGDRIELVISRNPCIVSPSSNREGNEMINSRKSPLSYGHPTITKNL